MSNLRVALTFDAEHPDRPHHLVGSEDRLRETLGSLEVRGTFFVQGRWAEAFPDQARRIADDGHLIGNHSHYHAKMNLLTEAGLVEDIKAAAGAIETICKRDPAVGGFVRYFLSVVSSLFLWWVIGHYAARRAIQSTISSWPEWLREFRPLAIGVALGSIISLVLAAAILGVI